MLRRVLSRSGVPVDLSVVEDGDSALHALDQPDRTFDLVLLDLHLPGRSGLEVLAALRDKTGPVPPVVVLTGSSSPAEAQEARRLGARSVVEVPCDLSRLQDTLEGVFRAYLGQGA